MSSPSSFESSEEYHHLDGKIAADVVSKVEYFEFIRQHEDYYNVKVIIFGDNEPRSMRIWKYCLKDMGRYLYLQNYPLIPIPSKCNPEQHRQYILELDSFISAYLLEQNYHTLVAGVFNFGTEESPRMHLSVAYRRPRKDDIENLREESSNGDANDVFLSILQNEIVNELRSAMKEEGSDCATEEEYSDCSTGVERSVSTPILPNESGTEEESSHGALIQKIKQHFSVMKNEGSETSMDARSFTCY